MSEIVDPELSARFRRAGPREIAEEQHRSLTLWQCLKRLIESPLSFPLEDKPLRRRFVGSERRELELLLAAGLWRPSCTGGEGERFHPASSYGLRPVDHDPDQPGE